MTVVLDGIMQVVTIALLIFMIAALVAPFEALGWWAGWSKRWPDPLSLPPIPLAKQNGKPKKAYLIYLSGVGITNAERPIPKEQNFIEMLQKNLADTEVIWGIFPYSSVNNPLTGARLSSRFWAWTEKAMRRRWTRDVFRLVAIRNTFQVAVSADRRYGPVYNFGVARAILLRLLDAGYEIGSSAPIIVMGLSGSGQIAVGSGAVLHRLLNVPIWVISIGGVLTSDPSILEIEHVYHLEGSKDHTHYLGQILYPGCWPIFPNSAWNRAMAAGKRTRIAMGPMNHMSKGDYFSRSSFLSDGRSHVEHTVTTISGIVEEIKAKVYAN